MNKEQQKDKMIKITKEEYNKLKDERDEYYAQADRLQEKLAQVLMRVDKTKEWTLDRAKIEGAKEFTEMLKEKAHKGASRDPITYKFIEHDYTITESKLNELLKEYEE